MDGGKSTGGISRPTPQVGRGYCEKCGQKKGSQWCECGLCKKFGLTVENPTPEKRTTIQPELFPASLSDTYKPNREPVAGDLFKAAKRRTKEHN